MSDENIQPEKKKKIKDRLKIFLRRRPTLESLREKGIFKGMWETRMILMILQVILKTIIFY